MLFLDITLCMIPHEVSYEMMSEKALPGFHRFIMQENMDAETAQQAHLPESSRNALLNSSLFSPAITKAISMVIHHLNQANDQLGIAHDNSWR